MGWLGDWNELRERGVLPVGSDLPSLIERRLTWEVNAEYGLRARIGRTLPRSGASVATVDGERLGSAVTAIAPHLREAGGGLAGVASDLAIHRFLSGLLVHLLERGGVLHAEVPDAYVESGGRDSYSFRMQRHLGLGPRNLPVFYADRSTSAFEA